MVFVTEKKWFEFKNLSLGLYYQTSIGYLNILATVQFTLRKSKSVLVYILTISGSCGTFYVHAQEDSGQSGPPM